ncbi:MAG: tetratricopeptide repeat protein [Planctomycetota bacterium]
MRLLASLVFAAVLAAPRPALPAPPPAGSLSPNLAESTRDRVHAALTLAQAEQSLAAGEKVETLRLRQRAWRWDRSAVDPLTEIVPLAFETGRVEEAVRYLLLDPHRADPALLRRTALYCSERGRDEDALRLYRLWQQAKQTATEEEEDDVTRFVLLLEVARLEHATGDAAAASDTYQKVQRRLLSDPPGSKLRERLEPMLGAGAGGLWEVLGVRHLAADELDRAESALEQLLDSPESEPRGWLRLAEVSAARGKATEAYERLRRCLSLGGSELRGEPYELLERLGEAMNDRDGFLLDLERLQAPDRPRAKLALAEAYAAAGDGDRAFALYRDLLTGPTEVAQPAAAWLIRRLGRRSRMIDLPALLGPIGNAFDSFDPLNDVLAGALEDRRSANRLLASLGRWRLEDKSVAELRAAAWLTRRAGRVELAQRLHDASIDKSPADEADWSLTWAVDLLLEDHADEAVAELRRGLAKQLWPSDWSQPHLYLSAALSMLDDYDGALAAARTAASLEPDSADLAARVAWVLQGADRDDDAIREFKQLIETFDDDPDPDTRQTLLDAQKTLSYLLLARGEPLVAAEWLERVLDEFPDEPGALNDLAYLWADRGEHLQRAKAMAQRAVAAEPDSAAYWDTLAWAEFKLGEAEAALATLDRAIELEGEPADGELLDHRGDILAALGRADEAADAWRLAAERMADASPDLAELVREKLARPKTD